MTAAAHDLVVIGSGPAGSVAALAACRAGLRTALIDRAVFPRDKLCGGGVTVRAWTALADVFGPDLPEGLFVACRRLRLTFGAEVLGDIPDAPALHMTTRSALDAELHRRAAQAGAEVLAGVRLRSLDPDSGEVTLDNGRVLSGRVILGADGVNSAVARQLFGAAFDHDRIGFGLEVEAPYGPDLPDPAFAPVEIDLGAARWGYGWAFPKPGSVTIGVGGLARHNPDMKAHLAAYLARHGVDAGDLRVKGHFLPFGDFRRVAGRGRVMLAGDAAGLVDPITGEGIAWAVISGALAAQSAVQALESGRPETAAALMTRALRPVHAELSRARALRALIYPEPLRDRFARALMRQPRVQRRYMMLLAGQMDYADIGWHSLPRLMLGMLRGGSGVSRA